MLAMQLAQLGEHNGVGGGIAGREGGPSLHHIDQLFGSTQSAEKVRHLLQQGGVLWRHPEPALKLCERFLIGARSGQQRSEFEQAADRRPIAAAFDLLSECVEKCRVVTSDPLDVSQAAMDPRVISIEFGGAFQPDARGVGIRQLIEQHSADGQGEACPLLGIVRQLVGALVQIDQQLPLLSGLGDGGEGFESLAVGGVVGQRPAVEIGGADRVVQGTGEQAGPRHQRRRALLARVTGRQLFPEHSRLGGFSQRLIGARRTLQSVQPTRLLHKCAPELIECLFRIAELVQPDPTDLGEQPGPFFRGHGHVALELGDLECDLPLLPSGVESAQLGEGDASPMG